jgi:hypothetical protein
MRQMVEPKRLTCAGARTRFEDSDIAEQISGVLADSKAAGEARVFTVGVGTSDPKASSPRSSLPAAPR